MNANSRSDSLVTVDAGANAPTAPLSSVVYLDYHATTPVDPRVSRVVLNAMAHVFGNANSVDHVFGEVAAAAVSSAAGSVANLVGADADDVFFTSGSTEAIRLAIAHSVSRHDGHTWKVALTRVEHKAVIDAVVAAARLRPTSVSWIEVDRCGRISWPSLESALSGGVDLVCVMAANNEVGTVYPIQEVAERVHAADAAVLVDATQAVGRMPLSARAWRLDYLVLSAHKIYGPKGVGALVAEEGAALIRLLEPVGTANVPGIAGFGEACRLRHAEMSQDEPRIAALRDRLESLLRESVPGIIVNGDLHNRLTNNLHVSVPGVPNDAVVGRLRRSVAISTGAACASGSHTPSHVLRAMGLPEALQDGALRISLGKFTTCDEIELAAREIGQAVKSVRSAMAGEAR